MGHDKEPYKGGVFRVSVGSALAADLIEIPEQPWLGSCERIHSPKCVPNRKTASHKLIPTRRVHWVDGHEAATKGDRPFRSVCTGRVVLWHDQAMPARIAVNTGGTLVHCLAAQDSSMGSHQKILQAPQR